MHCILLKRGNKYDVVYDAVHGGSQWLGILRKIGFLRAKLVTVMHQSPYVSFAKLGSSDRYIFFSEGLKGIAIEENPKFMNCSSVNIWGPDLTWYEQIGLSSGYTDFCIDNGKSSRDSDLLLEAGKQLSIGVYAYGNKDHIIKENVESDEDMLKRTAGYKVLAIPVCKRDQKQDVVCGLTSYMDALALRMPIIASDNVSFAWEIDEYGLGLLYKTGDIESLKAAIKKLHDDESFFKKCRENITEYTRHSNINEYSKRLEKIFDNL